ncbi:hypothetical protein F0562_020035 [Nyssa sinensis]|uniref:ATP-dependent Clp protease proteolytic subunit n=1 Tax=Nyssa sinensis TaxID=561372 RepID=A0A5J5BVF0_9ASTE|nr:hypothetical protein F0562_020035 [Nyssa sinensis]
MFAYFDTGRHWVLPHGLAIIVLIDMLYFMESPGNQQILAAVIRHLDHKNISHNPQTKSYVIQIATALTRQIRSGAVLSDIGFLSDLCRHLRKSLQATVELHGEQESNLNIALQNSIEDCLLEIAKGVADTRPLFDLMAITLEKLPFVGAVARATLGSLTVLAHMIALASVPSHSQLVFPEALLVQLLKAMLHLDVEARVGAHQIFSVLLIPNSNYRRHDVSNHTRRWHSNTASAFASITALLEKLRREKDGTKVEKHGINVQDDMKERDTADEELKQGQACKNSPNFYKLRSLIDRTAGSTNLAEAEPYIMKFGEDQIAQLLSAFWMQANIPDNLPSNVEAIAHSFCLTLLSSRLRCPNDNLVVRFFQLPLSFRNLSLDPNHGMPPSYKRSLLILSTAMLLFAAKTYQIPELNEVLQPLVEYDVDPYISISNDFQVYVKPQANAREYGSATDNQAASSLLSELRDKIYESNKIMLDTLVQSLSGITELKADDIVRQLSEAFTPDDAFMFGPQSILDLDHIQTAAHSKEPLSFDGDIPINSLVEDDMMSESSVADLARFIPKMPASPSVSHIISIGQLLESALEVAGQVAGTSVSTSPLPYSTMASQCEALGTGTRKKLSSWLTHENHFTGATDKLFPAFPAGVLSTVRKVPSEGGSFEGGALPVDPWLALRLPPASPFDNFIRAARGIMRGLFHDGRCVMRGPEETWTLNSKIILPRLLRDQSINNDGWSQSVVRGEPYVPDCTGLRLKSNKDMAHSCVATSSSVSRFKTLIFSTDGSSHCESHNLSLHFKPLRLRKLRSVVGEKNCRNSSAKAVYSGGDWASDKTFRGGIWSIRDDLQVPTSPYFPAYAQGGQGPPPMVQERFQSVISQLFQHRIIRCGGAVDDDMANIIVAQLLYLDAVDPTKDIVMYVNSPGGSVTAGMAIFDTMRHIRPDVSTVCVGLAAR